MKIFSSIILILLAMLTQTACWTTPEAGTVQVQTIWHKPTQIVHPPGIWTIFTIGDDYYDVNLRSKTREVDVAASTKDNAALAIKVATTYHVLETDDKILKYVNTFGFNPDERQQRLDPILAGQVNTEVKNAIANFDAYNLLASQQQIQKQVFERLKLIFENQLYMALESIQIIGRPDFLDDRIENAASGVVAATKEKEAAEARLASAKVDAETKQVQAQTFQQSSALLEIRKLELQREIAEAWAKHNGTLIFGNSNPVQLVNK